MKSGIIVGAMSFEDNLYDADTLEPQLKQIDRLTGRLPKTGIVDRGYRGRKAVLGVEIRIPGNPKKNATNYEKQKARKFFKAREGIEPVIGHVKHDHRMIRNYLSGTQGDMVNYSPSKLTEKRSLFSINSCIPIFKQCCIGFFHFWSQK